jgi:F1F0 ATPase subunit 2
MNETVTIWLACIAGGMLGTIFFGGLWWTVRKGLSAKQPALWFLVSRLVRMSVTVAGFYIVSAGHSKRLLSCLLGFVLASVAVTRLTRRWNEPAADRAPASQHAP